jgi:hypothetical protein
MTDFCVVASMFLNQQVQPVGVVLDLGGLGTISLITTAVLLERQKQASIWPLPAQHKRQQVVKQHNNAVHPKSIYI